MNNALTISIIIPVYNAEKYISRCLESWLHQTYSYFELVVINDGSTDNSKLICEEYSKKDNRIKLINTENFGVSHARNIGLKNVTGDIIGFCDADDFVHSQTLEIVYNTYTKYRKNIVSIGYTNDLQEHLNNYDLSNLNTPFICDALEFTQKIFYNKRISGFLVTKYFKKELITKKFDETLTHSEDIHWLVNNLIDNLNEEVAILVVPLYYYVILENSASHSINNSIDKNGQLKYISGYEKIMDITNNVPKVQEYCKCNIFEFSVINVSKISNIEPNTFNKLKKYIMKYKNTYFNNKHYKFNFKTIIRLILISNKLH